MKIAILGSRGIPNYYGGFEGFAQMLGTNLVKRGHEVTVYSTPFNPYKEDTFEGIKIIRKSSPEHLIRSAANFYYDYLCLKDAARQDFDIIFELGYFSVVPAYYLVRPSKAKVVTHMDGMEWMRGKWSLFVQKLMKRFEREAIRHSHCIISDGAGIQRYFDRSYGVESELIAYATNILDNPNPDLLKKYNLEPYQYFITVARLEPENNTQMIVEGYDQSKSALPMVVIGNTTTKLGKELTERYKNHPTIRFIGGVYNKEELDNLRHYAKMYLHGHTVGGTNPSLVDAMGMRCFVVSHDNEFNRDTLGAKNLYFHDPKSLAAILRNSDELVKNRAEVEAFYLQEVAEKYTEAVITDKFEALFERLLTKNDLLKPVLKK